jgi:hypothetical protein
MCNVLSDNKNFIYLQHIFWFHSRYSTHKHPSEDLTSFSLHRNIVHPDYKRSLTYKFDIISTISKVFKTVMTTEEKLNIIPAEQNVKPSYIICN